MKDSLIQLQTPLVTPQDIEHNTNMLHEVLSKTHLSQDYTIDERTERLAEAAQEIDLYQQLDIPCQPELTGISIPPAPHLKTAVSKILNGLHLIPEMCHSRYWQSMTPECGKLQLSLCQDFVDAGQPINGRIRIDSVICDLQNDGPSAKLVEFEPHCGGDTTHTLIHDVYEKAGLHVQPYTQKLIEHLSSETIDNNGKIRFVQWPKEQRTDIDYHNVMEQLLVKLRHHGLDAKQYDYNDPAADWHNSLVYRLFEFSEAHKSHEQQAMIKAHNQGELKLANPAFAFGKLVPLFISEFPELFATRLNMTAQELDSFPYSVSVLDYMTSPELQKSKPYSTLFLKGIFSAGSGGGNDVHPLHHFDTWEKAKAFIEKMSNDENGGWILQEEIPRAHIDFLQRVQGEQVSHMNKHAGILQRQMFLATEPVAHINYSTSRYKGSGDEKIHAEKGVAIFI